MLTTKQKELLIFIHERLQATGVPPSFDEMKDALDLKSKSGIHRLITALEEREFIRRLPHRARALEVLRLPENMHEAPAKASAGSSKFNPSVIEGSRGKQRAMAGENMVIQAMSVPLMGRIAAGVPIAALQNHNYDVEVPPSMVSGGEHFALEVKGDSMIEAGILEGDVVIIQRCDNADNGDIVVALDRLGGGDPQAAAQARRHGGAGSRQPGLRDAHLRARPRRHPRQARRPHPQVPVRPAE